MPGLVTVTVAATSRRLTSLDAARLEVGQDTADDDLILGKLIDRASAVIAGHTGRVFGVETVAETFRLGWWYGGIGPIPQFSGQGAINVRGVPTVARTAPLTLARDPVTTLAMVVENGTTLDPAADFEVDTTAALLYRLRSGCRSWWCGPAVVVTYSAGYVLPNDPTNRTLPEDAEDACLALIRSAYAARGRDPTIITDMLNGDRMQYREVGAGSMTLDDGLKAQLASYVVHAW